MPDEDTTRPMPDPAAQGPRPRADDRGVRLALAVSLLLLAVLTVPVAARAAGTPILVQLEPGVSSAERADVHDDAGVQRVAATALPRTQRVKTCDGSTTTALRGLNRDGNVAWAAQNVTLRTADVPNDPRFGGQWALQ